MSQEITQIGGRIKILRVIARLNVGGPAIHMVLLTAGLDRKRFDSPLRLSREPETARRLVSDTERLYLELSGNPVVQHREPVTELRRRRVYGIIAAVVSHLLATVHGPGPCCRRTHGERTF